jgi:hypothetical protein
MKQKIVVIVDGGICQDVISNQQIDVMVYDIDFGTVSGLPLHISHRDSITSPKSLKKLFDLYGDKCGATKIHKDDPITEAFE